jgi:hypothetical protein
MPTAGFKRSIPASEWPQTHAWGQAATRINTLRTFGKYSTIRHQLYSAFGKSLCPYKRCWKWCPRASIQAWTRLILFANTFCRSAFGKSLCAYKRCWKWCLRASIQAWTKSTYRSLTAQRLTERTVLTQLCLALPSGLFPSGSPIRIL